MRKTHRKLNLLFVAGCWYPTTEAPVGGIFIRRHAAAVAREHRVTVLHPTPPVDGLGAGRHWRRQDGVDELYSVFAPATERRLGVQLGYWRAGRSGMAEFLTRAGAPDLVHFHVVPSLSLIAAVLSSLPAPTPLVITEHWTGYIPGRGPRLGPLRRLYTRWLTRRAGCVTTVSHHLEQVMRQGGFDGRYEVIPNVVDTELFTLRPERRPGPPRFLSVCALRAVKRVPDMVRAVGRLHAQGVPAELHVVGDGPEREAIRAAANELQAPARIILHGRLDGQGVAAQLQDSDALVLFSDFENSPCVIGEALACGCPVVATDVAGVPEHLPPEHGILVQPGDLQALMDALARVARDPAAWDPAALRRYAVATFSPEVVGTRFSEVYATCLDTSSQ